MFINSSWDAPALANPTRSAVAREAIEERKLAETYLQCNNMGEAQRHLAQVPTVCEACGGAFVM